MLRQAEREDSAKRRELTRSNLRYKLSDFIDRLPYDAPIPFRLKLQEALTLLEG